MKRILIFILILISSFGINQAVQAQGATYYANTSGEATNLANWDDVGDGSGNNPLSFDAGDLFIITDGFHMTVSTSNWVLKAPDSIAGIQVDFGGSLTVAATRYIDIPRDGSFILDGDYIHNSALVIDRDFFDSPSINAGSTVTLGANQTWNSLYPNLIFANLILNTGVTATCSRQISLDGTLTLNGTALLNINANVTMINLGSFTSQLGTGTVRTIGQAVAALPSNVTWSGLVHLNAGQTVSQTLPPGTYNNVTISQTSSGSRTLSGSISISGTFTANTGNYVTTGSTINYNGAAAQSIPAAITTYNNLTISNAGTKTMNGNIQVNGTLNVSNSSGILALNGNTLTLQNAVSLTGSLAGSSTSNLTIGGAAGGNANIRLNAAANDSLLNNLTLNRTGTSAGLTLQSNVGITNLLSITNGTFDVNGRIVTLKSSSISNTAQLAAVTGTLTLNGGSFTTERFIPQGNRAYRDFAPGVHTATGVNFFHTWQENGSNAAGLGIHITGIAGASPGGNDATTGLDITQAGARSLFTYENGVWSSGVTNTKTTKPNVYQGYRTFVRGDRNVNLYIAQSAMNTATVIRANGTPITGIVTYTTSGITNAVLNSSYSLNNNNSANDYSLIANPYLCAIDWAAVSRTNISSSYTVFDPTIGTNGAYVTCNTAGVNSNPLYSDVDQYIQSGQAFFVQTTAAGPQLVISESNKNTANKTSVFRTATNTINKLSFGLFRQIPNVGLRNVDGCVALFDANETNDINDEDARKLSNSTENISILNNSVNLSIESKRLPEESDTIHLRLWQLANNTNYTFSVNTNNFTTNKLAYLIDAFTNTEKLLKVNDTTNVSFTALTANTATFTNRFKIVFRNNAALTLSSINLQATAKNNGVDVSWNTTNEIDLYSFEIERSNDAISFIKQASVTAKNASENSYSFFDANIKTGLWYYRIKIIEKNGSFKYTNIVAINLNNKNNDFAVFPNPVKGKHFTVQFSVAEQGNYQIQLVNQSGQIILQKSTQLLPTINVSILVDLKQQNLPYGNYSVVLTNENGLKLVKQLIIVE